MVNKFNLQRDELADFLGEKHKAIRQFEKLFQSAGDSANSIEDIFPQLIALVATLGEQNNQAEQQIQSLSVELEDLRKQVADIQTSTFPVDQDPLPYLETRKQVVSNKPGRINWTSTGQFNAGQDAVNIPIGAMTVVRAVNASGLNLGSAKAVRISGSSGSIVSFNLAGCETDKDCIGLTATAINSGDTGFIVYEGVLENVDATGAPYGEVWNNGDVIYVGVGSALTKAIPTKPFQQVPIAVVVNATTLFVIPTRNMTALQLSDFNINSPLSGDLLIYDATSLMWDNKRLTQNAGGIVITNLDGEIRLSLSDITNDQTSSLMSSSVSLNNGAAAAFGTITNAPFAGNPTKWIPIDDNGTIRHFPSW